MEIKEIHWSFACKSRGSFRLNAPSPETNLLRKLGKAIRSSRSTREMANDLSCVPYMSPGRRGDCRVSSGVKMCHGIF